MDDNMEIDEGRKWKDMTSSELAWKVVVLESQVEFGRALQEHELRRIDEGSLELCRRFCNRNSTVDGTDVETAISWQTLALQFTDEHAHSNLLPSRLHALGVSCALRFESSSDLSDLDEASTWIRCAIEIMADDVVAIPHLVRLGLLRWKRFLRSDEIQDLEDAVLSLAQAAQPIAGLGSAEVNEFLPFFARFEAVRQSGLLEQFITALQRSNNDARDHGAEVEDCLDSHVGLLPTMPTYMIDVHNTLRNICLFVTAIRGYLRECSQWLADTDDVDGALAAARCVLEITPDGTSTFWHDRQITAIHDLISALQRRFIRFQSLDDLCLAIDHLDRAFEFIVEASVDGRCSIVGLASGFVHHGLQLLPDGDLLTKCRRLVSRVHRALDQLPEEDIHGDDPQLMDQACNLYILRQERFRDADDLDAAIDVFRHLVHLYEAASVSLVRLFRPVHSLASLLAERYQLSRLDEDLDQAIETVTRAISRASTSDKERVADLENLLAALQSAFPLSHQVGHRRHVPVLPTELSPERFARYAALSQKDDACAGAEIASRAFAYNMLAKHFVALYDRTRDPSNRDLALAAYRGAIDTSQDDLNRQLLIRQLSGQLYKWNLLESPDSHPDPLLRPGVILELLELNDEELKCGGSSYTRLVALLQRASLYTQWSRAVAHFGEPASSGSRSFAADRAALDACEKIMDIAPSVISPGYSISRRYTEISHVGGVVRLAVATASFYHNPVALKWFEQGRAYVWRQILDLRTPADADRLQNPVANVTENGDGRVASCPQLQELASTARALETASGAKDAVAALRFERERQDILKRIRSTVNGLQDFLQPKDVNELVGACHTGAVVCLNVTDDRRIFALIPRRNRPYEETVMFLPIILDEHSNVNAWRQQLNLSFGLQSVRQSRPAVVRNGSVDKLRVLQELWYFIVRPVLELLSISTDEFPPNGADLPRITWCTTGALAFLPLHAAGPYDSRLPDAFDLVVSSYTPNLASILPSRSGVQAENPKILVVAQPNVAGFSSLPKTLEEANAVQLLFHESCVRLDGAKGTVDTVFEELRTYNYVHLACHGEQDSEDPLKSSFILHDGHRLTLDKLMEIAHSSDFAGEVAFLSACETATGDEKVPDEAVHLAAGMLAVGYRSVVATMWSIGDNHAPLVAGEFYKTLLAQPIGKKDVARALHAAVAALRKEVKVTEIAKWAPFVHYGL